MIRLTRTGLTLLATPAELQSARGAWSRVHHVTLPDLLDPALFAMIARGLEQTPFVERTHKGIGTELCAGGGRVLGVLQFLTNDPRLFAMVGELTGAGPIGCFEGRVYRQVPGTDHHDSWHDDVSGTRIVALSINLGAEPYQGGVLQIRERASGRVVAEVENTRPGGGVLFRIAEHLQHRITPVTGGIAKTAYAGWFREQPDFRDVLAGRATF
jgi:hypothetical protein